MSLRARKPTYLFRSGDMSEVSLSRGGQHSQEGSQGALCVRNCVNRIGDAARPRSKGMATSDDERALLDAPQPAPTGLAFQPFCVEETAVPNILCTVT